MKELAACKGVKGQCIGSVYPNEVINRKLSDNIYCTCDNNNMQEGITVSKITSVALVYVILCTLATEYASMDVCL